MRWSRPRHPPRPRPPPTAESTGRRAMNDEIARNTGKPEGTWTAPVLRGGSYPESSRDAREPASPYYPGGGDGDAALAAETSPGGGGRRRRRRRRGFLRGRLPLPAPARVVTSSATTRRSRGRSRRRRIERPAKRTPDADERRRRPRRTRFRRARARGAVASCRRSRGTSPPWARGGTAGVSRAARAGARSVGPTSRRATARRFTGRATGKSLRRGAGFATSSSAGRVDRAPRTRTKRAGASVS